MQLGADIYAKDTEGLTALDIILMDRKQTFPSLDQSPPAHVFTWGLNNNFTLGHAKSNSRQPSKVKFIIASQATESISIKQVTRKRLISIL